MSPIRHILVHLTDSPRNRAVLQLAAALARAQQATLRAVYAVDPTPPGAYLTPEASSIAMGMLLEAEEMRHAAVKAVVAEVAAARGQEIPLELAHGEPLHTLLDEARTADLLVSGQHDPEQPDGISARLAGRLLVGAGCPVLFVPYIVRTEAEAASEEAAVDAPEPRCGRRVLLAWSGKRESARALRDALPLLQQAEQVEVVMHATAAPAEAGEAEADPLAPVLAHLARHGVSATSRLFHASEPTMLERMQRPWTPDAPIAESLLSHAADSDADLIVMGGYGHSRAWELVLGGVTRTLLQTMTVPVLMSH
jgi:nucleotide-binding universal stress UspA family protein